MVAVLASLVISVGSGAADQSNVTGPKARPIYAVVLIDESGSETPASVRQESDAAATLAVSELSNQSAFSVAGFGSSNGPGETAVVPYCPFITLSSPDAREQVAACASRAHLRTFKEGYDTDHAAALRFAEEQLSSAPPGATRAIFLLTDGVLDVSHSPQYGRTGVARNQEAQRELSTSILPSAKHNGIQIWPLGFGPQANLPDLEQFAAGGAGAAGQCATFPGSRPHAIIVGSDQQVLFGLLGLLARARCASVNRPTTGQVGPNAGLTLHVHIPLIATDGAITVDKADPTFRVTYFDPNGNQAPSEGQLFGQTFSLAGRDERVEALRIQDPMPGDWTIKVTDPAGNPGQLVEATAVWQGELQGAIEVTPVLPQPGQAATIQMRLLTRAGVVTNAAALAGISASASLQGKFGMLSVPLADVGRNGVFKGHFVLPGGASGCVQIVGTISGLGIAADQRPYDFCPPPPGVSAVFNVNWPSTLHAGDSVSGAISLTNQQGAQVGHLVLSDVSANGLISVAPSQVSLANGVSQIPFTVRFARQSKLGSVTARLQLRNASGATIGESYIATQIVKPPSVFSRYWWLIPVVLILIAAAVVARSYRRRRHYLRARVYGLQAELQHDSGPVGRPVSAPPDGVAFLLQYKREDHTARIRPVLTENEATVRMVRSEAGVRVQFTDDTRVPFDVRLGGSFEVDDDYAIVVRQTDTSEGGRAGGTPGRGEPGDPLPQPSPPADPGI